MRVALLGVSTMGFSFPSRGGEGKNALWSVTSEAVLGTYKVLSLPMTKTAPAIIVAAVTVAAVLTTQTIVHHCRASNSSEGSQGQGQVKLAPPEAAEATQAARSFLEANGNGDWDTVAKFWPSNTPKGKRFEDVFTDQNKELVSGMQIVNLGTPYKENRNSWIMVPYEVRFKSGGTQKNNLRIGKGVDGHWTWQGGF